MAAKPAVRTVTLGPVEAIPLGEGRSFVVEGEEVAVFRTRGGGLFATQAFCPHARGPLADGLIGATTVLCPLHAAAFDLVSGRCLSSVGCADLRVYAVSLAPDGRLLLEVEKRGAARRSRSASGEQPADGGETAAPARKRRGCATEQNGCALGDERGTAA